MPPVVKLPPVIVPVALNVPATFTPVDVNTALAVALPATKIATLAFAVSVTFELPFCSSPLLIVVILPVVMIAVDVPMLPTLALAVTLKLPPVVKLAPRIVPVADIVPVTDKPANVPTAVTCV